MTAPIKTGAWVYLEERGEYLRCDLYEYAHCVLLARCNPMSLTRHPPPEEGLWATMNTYDGEFRDGDTSTTYVSTDYTLHYMLKFINGGWHDVKIA